METSFNEQLQITNKSSSSCPAEVSQTVHRGGRQRQEAPAFMTDDEARVWAKERHKKDSHNLSK